MYRRRCPGLLLRSTGSTMAESQHPSPSPRLAYLESIRGLAAMQVLLLHCFSAFAPALVFPPAAGANLGTAIHLSPLFFLYDGFSNSSDKFPEEYNTPYTRAQELLKRAKTLLETAKSKSLCN